MNTITYFMIKIFISIKSLFIYLLKQHAKNNIGEAAQDSITHLYQH